MSTQYLNVSIGALTPQQREALALLTDNNWRRMPASVAATATALERCGLVETECRWQWSTRDSGAGRHVMWWRRLTEGER